LPSLCVRQSFVVSISHLDLLWNYLAKWNQTLQIWCMEGSLQKYFILCYNIGQTTWIPCRGNSKLWFVKCKRKCHMKVQVQMIITNGVYESFHWDSSFRLDPAKTWLRWTIIVSDWLQLLTSFSHELQVPMICNLVKIMFFRSSIQIPNFIVIRQDNFEKTPSVELFSKPGI
jgi:hypothetical protein